MSSIGSFSLPTFIAPSAASDLRMPFNLPNLALLDTAHQQELPAPWSQPGPAVVYQQQNPVSAPFEQIWGVFYHGTMNAVFTVDTVVDLKFADTAKVASFPIEQGGFTSYDKVVEPYKPKIKLAVGGAEKIANFELALMGELRTVNLYDIVTPEATYYSVTLENYDYSRAQEHGKNLLVAELTFVQIAQVSPAYAKVSLPHPKNPGAGSKSVNGKTQTQPPAAPVAPPWRSIGADAAKAAGIGG